MWRTQCLLKARIHAFSPWKRRPSGLTPNSNPQFVHPGAYKSHRRMNPEDHTGLIKPSHMLLKHCSICNRTRLIPIAQRDHFHMCCEGNVMKVKGSMKQVMDKALSMQTLHRQWDVESNRPWSNATKPRPKGRSKYSKK